MGQFGVIQSQNISDTGCYLIEAYGGAGGTSNYAGKLWLGGLGAKVVTTERILENTTLMIVVGQRAGPILKVRECGGRVG